MNPTAIWFSDPCQLFFGGAYRYAWDSRRTSSPCFRAQPLLSGWSHSLGWGSVVSWMRDVAIGCIAISPGQRSSLAPLLSDCSDLAHLHGGRTLLTTSWELHWWPLFCRSYRKWSGASTH